MFACYTVLLEDQVSYNLRGDTMSTELLYTNHEQIACQINRYVTFKMDSKHISVVEQIALYTNITYHM